VPCSALEAEIGTVPRGWSSDANSIKLAGMKGQPPAPTLEQLRRGHPWTWVVCERCLHRAAVAFAPLIGGDPTPRAT
jgi:hypothetical protein